VDNSVKKQQNLTFCHNHEGRVFVLLRGEISPTLAVAISSRRTGLVCPGDGTGGVLAMPQFASALGDERAGQDAALFLIRGWPERCSAGFAACARLCAVLTSAMCEKACGKLPTRRRASG